MNLITHLRQATRASHEQIEATLNLFSEDFTIERYKNLIRQWAAFYRQIDQKIWSREEWGRIQAESLERKKYPWLKNDLVALGLRDDTVSKVTIPPLDFPTLLGWSYVIEGSTLGAQQISRYIQEKWQLGPENGGRFFYGYGPETGKMWQRYLAALALWEKENKDFSGVTEGALTAFQAVATALQ